MTERRKMRRDAVLFQTQAEMMALYRQYLAAPSRARAPAREDTDDEEAA
jgi:hypothetical protein